MKKLRNLKSILVTTGAFLLLSSAVLVSQNVKAGPFDCVNKYMLSYYDATSGCTYFEYFDTYTQAMFFKAMAAPGINWVYGGYHTYCGPLVSATCPGGPL